VSLQYRSAQQPDVYVDTYMDHPLATSLNKAQLNKFRLLFISLLSMKRTLARDFRWGDILYILLDGFSELRLIIQQKEVGDISSINIIVLGK
jgi:hypothetical protein